MKRIYSKLNTLQEVVQVIQKGHLGVVINWAWKT